MRVGDIVRVQTKNVYGALIIGFDEEYMYYLNVKMGNAYCSHFRLSDDKRLYVDLEKVFYRPINFSLTKTYLTKNDLLSLSDKLFMVQYYEQNNNFKKIEDKFEEYIQKLERKI